MAGSSTLAQPLRFNGPSRLPPGARSQFAHQPRAVGARTEDAMNLINRMRALVTDDAGQDLLEYALLVGLIALVAVVAVTATGTSVKNVFADVATRIKVPAAP